MGLQVLPLYSILITTYNAKESIEKSLESVFRYVDERFEVVVVDNKSTDGTLEYLKSLAETGKIKLIIQRCNRGEGRQMALETALGKYVISRMDADHYFIPAYLELLDLYIQKEKELGSFVLLCGPMISSREFLLGIGGWKPLQWNENAEIYKRLLDTGKLYLCRKTKPIHDAIKPLPSCNPATRASKLGKLKYSYEEYRDMLRAGLSFNVIREELWKTCRSPFVTFPIRLAVLCLSWIVHFCYTKYSTFKGVTWQEFFGDKSYADEMPLFELNHPDKVF